MSQPTVAHSWPGSSSSITAAWRCPNGRHASHSAHHVGNHTRRYKISRRQTSHSGIGGASRRRPVRPGTDSAWPRTVRSVGNPQFAQLVDGPRTGCPGPSHAAGRARRLRRRTLIAWSPRGREGSGGRSRRATNPGWHRRRAPGHQGTTTGSVRTCGATAVRSSPQLGRPRRHMKPKNAMATTRIPRTTIGHFLPASGRGLPAGEVSDCWPHRIPETRH